VYGYRRHPATAWELKSSVRLGICQMTSEQGLGNPSGSALGRDEIIKLLWHPFNLEVFGLCLMGLILKWDPYEEEPSLVAQTGAHFFTVNGDGSLVATGDTMGTIKILASADFSLVYQLSSKNPVLNLFFRPDLSRLYDIRGQYGNIWEPNTLVRLAETPESLDTTSDSLAETESLAKVSVHADHYNRRPLDITALAGQQADSALYCYDTANGLVFLAEVGSEMTMQITRPANSTCIEHITWSLHGNMVAIADLGRGLSVVGFAKDATSPWKEISRFDFTLEAKYGHLTQLFFHPGGGTLFASDFSSLYVIDISSRSITEQKLPADMPPVRWVCHPSNPDYVLGLAAPL
jgi:hypothetical protein